MVFAMKTEMKTDLAQRLVGFHLPRYAELPDMGLYLEQTAKYINQCLAPLGCLEVTGSMIRNYVKMGLAPHPVKKQYYAGQIAHLISVTVLKSALPLDHINRLLARQKKIYTDQIAYDYFCMELENMLLHIAGLKDTIDQIGVTTSQAKTLLRSVIISASHILFVSNSFRALQDKQK